MSDSITAETVLELIRQELVDAGVEEEAVTSEAKFDDLDIDSLDAAELMATIKRTYQVAIPRPELAEVTVGQLAVRVAEQAGR
ncbi:acyl carrier protein [Streptomyces sp. NBC_00400]|uniref:acyl carrier protein n=1 Tax=Streptomyces sp. NBC_00400 TaxID=2975737 RepID=UPI002E1EABB8